MNKHLIIRSHVKVKQQDEEDEMEEYTYNENELEEVTDDDLAEVEANAIHDADIEGIEGVE